GHGPARSTPVASAFGCVHPEAEQTGHHQTECLTLGETPLSGETPSLRLGLSILLSANHTFDVCGHQSGDGLGCHKDGENCYYCQAPDAHETILDAWPLRNPRLIENECSYAQAKHCTYVCAVVDAHADCESRQNGAEPGILV